VGIILVNVKIKVLYKMSLKNVTILMNSMTM